MTNRTVLAVCLILAALTAVTLSAQSAVLYPHATTDRLIHHETPMVLPDKGVVFRDPDFGSLMVRVTDSSTNFKLPGTYLETGSSGENNVWSSDTGKFFVTGDGGWDFAFAFDPATMAVSSLPNAGVGQGLLLPLRPGATFSFVDPDLIYGTADPDTLTITSYRFSTGVSTPVIDTRTCGVQPPLATSAVSDDDVSLSLDDSRVSISEGGSESGEHMFVVAYDKALGCRWYNTQTGQIGGQWGANGQASVSTPYLIRHAYLSKSGKYVVIMVNWSGWYVWDLATLNVSYCADHSMADECQGYMSVGYNTLVNGPAIAGDMQVAKRPLENITQIAQLVWPVPFDWDQVQHFTWSNADSHDTSPACGSTYDYEGDTNIDQPWAGEIFCIETDGLASTVWRFAHNRATYISPYDQTQPTGGVSMDGHFFLFTSNWDAQLGTGTDGLPLSDVFILKLD